MGTCATCGGAGVDSGIAETEKENARIEAKQKSLVRSMGERKPQPPRVAELVRTRATCLADLSPVRTANLKQPPGSAIDAFPWVPVEPGEDDSLQESDPVIPLHGVLTAVWT